MLLDLCLRTALNRHRFMPRKLFMRLKRLKRQKKNKKTPEIDKCFSFICWTDLVAEIMNIRVCGISDT